MLFQINQFASTCVPQPNGTLLLTNNTNLVLIDQNQSLLKPGESYLITISKIQSPQIIIEETQNESQETIEETETISEV